MLKSVRGFIIKNNEGKIVELESLEVKIKPIIKDEKVEGYIGIAEFKLENDKLLPNSFDISATIKDDEKTTERIYIKDCQGIVRIDNQTYMTNFNINNVNF